VASLILAAALGYLVGSIPFAYILVFWKMDLDIRREGSGNVGTLNSFIVSRSRLLALGVLILDLCKGLAAVLAARALITADFPHGAAAGLSAVLGHAYPLWLGFKGGRGLATAAGAFLVLNWLVVPVWLALWGISFLLVRAVNPANAIASAMTLAGALLAPPAAWEWALPHPVPLRWFRGVVILSMTVILIRLGRPVQEFIRRGVS
jgi:glycerol-3-phosphate acyltransferase PlsY